MTVSGVFWAGIDGAGARGLHNLAVKVRAGPIGHFAGSHTAAIRGQAMLTVPNRANP